ncbi:MAG: alkylhydroperoxidase-related (seleno)protein [Actinomycetota bacterium]
MSTGLLGRHTEAVRSDLREACEAEWYRLGRPGQWWSGAERVAIAAEVRAARACSLCRERRARVSAPGPGGHQDRGPLPAAAVDAVHRITTDPGRLTSRWYESVLEGGVSAEQFVELVGVVAATVMVDTLALGLGVSPPPLPAPEPGEPGRIRPAGIAVHSAWVPTVVPEEAEGELASFYELMKYSPFVPNRPDIVGFVPNITRALTLVPPEQFGFAGFLMSAYLSIRDLSEPQQQLLAATVSTANDCFY